MQRERLACCSYIALGRQEKAGKLPAAQRGGVKSGAGRHSATTLLPKKSQPTAEPLGLTLVRQSHRRPPSGSTRLQVPPVPQELPPPAVQHCALGIQAPPQGLLPATLHAVHADAEVHAEQVSGQLAQPVPLE